MATLRGATRLALLLSLAVPVTAVAQKGGKNPPPPSTTYTRAWDNVCGGTSFTTCASVQLIVTGVNVEIRAWNLSGGSLGGQAGAVIRSISLLNMGSLATTSTVTTGGTYYTGATMPYPFSVTDSNADAAGTVEISKSTLTSGINDPVHGLASSCATGLGVTPGTPLWMTAAGGCTTGQIGSTSGNSYVQFNFAMNQAFDPNAQGVQLGITSVDLTSPMVTSYAHFYSTPEPVTLVLLGSGLLGIGGVGLKRRRRDDESADPL